MHWSFEEVNKWCCKLDFTFRLWIRNNEQFAHRTNGSHFQRATFAQIQSAINKTNIEKMSFFSATKFIVSVYIVQCILCTKPLFTESELLINVQNQVSAYSDLELVNIWLFWLVLNQIFGTSTGRWGNPRDNNIKFGRRFNYIGISTHRWYSDNAAFRFSKCM